jgi:heme/copper-type cytochrome/quinol oxidase subunit 2
MTILTATLLFQQVVSEAHENRVLFRVMAIGLAIFFLSAGALYAFFRSFEHREQRTGRRTMLLLGTLIGIVVLACIFLFKMAIASSLY